MRILSIGNFGTSWDGSICDEEHIASALEGLGHEVIRHQRDEENDNPRFFENKIDFVLIAQYDHYKTNMVEVLRGWLKCPIVYWAFDYQDQNQEWHKRLVEQADLYLSKRIADSVFSNWHWLSQDFFPELLRDADIYPSYIYQDIDVLFTGTYLPWATERNETLKAIDDLFNLQIHSVNPEAWIEAGFKNVGGPILDGDLPRLIRRAKINISIDHTIEAGYWSDRTAQIQVCGGFVLMRYVPLAESRFEYVPFFKNTATALDMIDKWLHATNARDIAAVRGQKHALAHLGVIARAIDLITIVENSL